MGLRICPFLLLHCWVFLVLGLGVDSDQSAEVSLKIVRSPHAISNTNSTTFAFQVLVGGNGGATLCTNCSTICKLDQGNFSACEDGRSSYTRLVDGNHSFEVCTNGAPGAVCASYNWTIDTVSPTAQIISASSFTNASRVPVNITFSESCGGFSCSSANACNLIVYGPGKVVPDTLSVIEPNLKYSIVVRVSSKVWYGRLVLVMDRNFCTDSAGNQFTRTENSSLLIRFDRRNVFVDLRTRIPETLLQIESDTRTILATNKNKNLKVYLYFSEPVVNSSSEILGSLNTTEGALVPVDGNSLGQRRFGYQLTNVSDLAIVTVSLHSDLIISRQGIPVTPVAPVSFLYDSQRPTVRLSTTCDMQTKEKSILVQIKFLKPVFGFNSSHVSISGGHLESFHEMSRSSYAAHVQAISDVISINVPENITTDVSGNRNRASNILQVRHYSVPVESLVISWFATTAFVVTALIAGLLTVSTTGLLSNGAFTRPTSILCSDPARNLFRIASHIQVFALSRWLAVTLPVEYYELTRGLQWSIPYLNLPWESRNKDQVVAGSTSPKYRLLNISEVQNSMFLEGLIPQVASPGPTGTVYGLPLTPLEYRTYFESQNILPQAEYISEAQNSHGWRDFSRSMFWLAVIGGSLILLHALLLVILKIRKKNKDKQSYGALIFPRLEIFLVILALPCLCASAAALIRGGAPSGTVVGILILSLIAFLLLFLLLFLSFGITLGNLLQYKEVHQMGKKFHWYQELIRVTLGPGKRGQWTWKDQSNSKYLTILGPLFEDLRGPPKYMLSQISGSSLNRPGDRIIASDDETEDAEAPFIQKLFGILRIYYTLIECVKRVVLGVMAGAYTKASSSRAPAIILLCITSFQLFFMVLKKPFIKKKVQLVEIVSISCQVSVFAFCVVLLEREFSAEDERKLGIAMTLVFLLAFMFQMINEWYALYRQVKQLDPVKGSFLRGLKTGFVGLFLFFCPSKLTKKVVKNFPVDIHGEMGNDTLGDRVSGGSGEKVWLRRIRELARSSFSKDGNKANSNDPSSSKPRWSDFWKSKRSGSSSASTSTDFKARPKGLDKELEEIFANK